MRAARHWGGSDDEADIIAGREGDDGLIGGAGGDTISVSASKPAVVGPYPSFPAPKQDLDYGQARDFMEREAAKRGFSINGYPGSFKLENNGRRYDNLDADAIAATDDVIRNFPQSEFIEAGVKLNKRGWFNGGYNYSRGISGGPTEIPAAQWDKLRSLNPFDKTATTLHFHDAYGPQSLAPSASGDIPYAKNHFGSAGQYIFNWQDGRLRHFNRDGGEARIVYEYPDWKPR